MSLASASPLAREGRELPLADCAVSLALDRPLARIAALVAATAASYAAELAAAAAAVLLYLPALRFGFVFDDGSLIDASGWPQRLGGLVPYRPLRYASYLVDGWLGGTPWIYHAHNIALHALACALVASIARRLGAARIAAAAAGLLVAVHPIAVESVAYVAGRRDLLCVALGLAAVLVWIRGRAPAALVLVVLATAAKESGLLFASPLVAASVAGIGPRMDDASQKRALAALFAAAIAVAALLVAGYGAVGPWGPAGDVASVAFVGRVAMHYASGLLGLRSFAPEYPALLQYSPAAGELALHLLFAAAIAGAVVLSLRRCRRASGSDRSPAFAAAWTAMAMLAVAIWGGLHEPGADRHAYLLLAPIAIAAALLLTRTRLVHAPRYLAPIAIAALLLASAAASYGQMQIWGSEGALWTRAAADPAASSRVHANLARSLALEGNLRGATGHLHVAIERDPANPRLYLGLAALRCAAGHPSWARRDLERARVAGAAGGEVAAVEQDCNFPLAVSPVAAPDSGHSPDPGSGS
ncbi:MAG TPA: hypothetical protein VGK20_05645 [Candidatus Binatia bacterium]|jgi:hypothetical protein